MSLNASTASSSYSMSAGVCRATMRQKRQSVTKPPANGCYNTASEDPAGFERSQRSDHGYVSEVQAEDPQERQSHQARLDLVSQELPRAPVREVLIAPRYARGRSFDFSSRRPAPSSRVAAFATP